MGAIIKKEFKSYFFSPVGYIFIGAFLITFSIFFFISVVQSGSVKFEYIFYNGATILTFIVPLLTMRSFAEERKTGVEQLILTSPISITKIVLAKFIAAVLIIILTEICSLMYFAILCHYGTPYIPTALLALLGFLLLSMSYISFGILASSITENQIIAGAISILFFVLVWFLPSFNYSFADFSLINMLTGFLQGRIEIAQAVNLVAFTIMCILLTIIFMQRRKSAR